ncbi:MAG TPA: SDR family NAD(P)-dependent oxidoreductase [Solirubrobacteraceae bacterium]
MTQAKTLAIVGAGPGLGLSIAKRFGAAGFQVALLARNASKLGELTAELERAGVTARSYVADITDRAALVAALASVDAEMGPVDVLEFGPMPAMPPVSAPNASPEDVQSVFEQQVLGAVAAVNAVLPGMRSRGSGALLITTGASSVTPIAMMGAIGPAMAALRNYAITLHQALAHEGVYAAHVAIDLRITPGAGEADPDALAERYFELYEQRDRAEIKVGNLVAEALAAAATRT